ncbi:T-lymphocyte surface antigen Ly-9-like isoform X3 [Anarrhichthys ocellatus]|uniref:T-lymphocyte surface antigen Ly-9-like isoform X3 n=1 Tax=Anarrhichthys ocellatus TaxID=433405 RepID=UPI0012EDE82A|nr:T-lymphocyte surface antigen Ly-9-like isoform X3 [Anarrhichthys ocellatus]
MAARYFLLCVHFIVSCLVAGQSPNYGLKGGKVSLKPRIPGQPDGILWKTNGNKVVEFDGREELVYSPYQNRITLDWQTADINIHDLRFEDSGEYELDAEINKRLHRSFYTLEVIEKVAKPTITCEMKDEGRSNTAGKLLCSANLSQPQPLMKFEWREHGNVQPGSQLQISLGDKHDDEVYSCTVSNRLSKETATFTAKDCYPEESSAALLIALLVTGAVLLLVGLAILYCKLRNKGSDTEQAQADERRALVHRASTLPSTVRLGHLVQEPEKEADEDEEGHSAPAGAETSPAARPHSPLTESSPNMAPKDTAGEHEEVDNSDHVTGESAEKNVRESDSSDEEERNESDDSSEDKLLSTVPEQRGSKTILHEQSLNLSQEEKNTSEDNQQETVKPVSEDEEESKTESAGDHEEPDREQDLYSTTSQQPRSPTPTKPDNRSTDTCQESPATAYAHPEEEEEEEEHKTGTDSDETAGQSDKGEQGNESFGGDNAGQKKDEVVA